MPNPVEPILRIAAEGLVALVATCNRLRLPRTPHPFVVGVHAPKPEELTLPDLPVTGTIPAGLDGRYLKMGANPAHPTTRRHDWFLDDGMVHGLCIEGGKALWYRNRWIGSRAASASLGRPAAPGPRRGDDTVNTNVVEIGGRAFAVVEAGSYPVALSDDLKTQRYELFDGTLAGSFSGHPHRATRQTSPSSTRAHSKRHLSPRSISGTGSRRASTETGFQPYVRVTIRG